MPSRLPGVGGSNHLDVEYTSGEDISCWIVINITRFLWSSPLFSPWQSHCSTGLYGFLSCHCGPSWWSPEKRCSHPFFDFQSFFLKESRCLSSPLTFPPKRGHSQSALRQIYKVNNAIEFSISSFACATSFVRQQLLNYLGVGKSSQFLSSKTRTNLK